MEVKFCDDEPREKELIGEINDYILAFKTRYPNLIFVVYDMGIIRDEEGFVASFEKQDSVIVKVIKNENCNSLLVSPLVKLGVACVSASHVPSDTAKPKCQTVVLLNSLKNIFLFWRGIF